MRYQEMPIEDIIKYMHVLWENGVITGFDPHHAVSKHVSVQWDYGVWYDMTFSEATAFILGARAMSTHTDKLLEPVRTRLADTRKTAESRIAPCTESG